MAAESCCFVWPGQVNSAETIMPFPPQNPFSHVRCWHLCRMCPAAAVLRNPRDLINNLHKITRGRLNYGTGHNRQCQKGGAAVISFAMCKRCGGWATLVLVELIPLDAQQLQWPDGISLCPTYCPLTVNLFVARGRGFDIFFFLVGLDFKQTRTKLTILPQHLRYDK